MWSRISATQNVISVLVGLTVFLIGLRLWDTTIGVLVSALAGAVASSLVWLTWWYVKGPPAAAKILGTTHLGTVRHGKVEAPTLVDPDSQASMDYRDMIKAIEAHTTGQVFLVSPVELVEGPPSTITLNLAVAATRLGRRAVLIDGGLSGTGPSRFSSSGEEVGLSDLATGDASLADSSQVWAVGEESLLPVVTAGTHSDADDVPFDGLDLAAAFDLMGERADIILIDTPPIVGHPSTGKLAAHSDGSILVVGRNATTAAMVEARDRLEEAGAPVMGLISDGPATGWAGLPLGRMLKRSGAFFLILTLFYLAFTTGQLWNSWNGVARESLDTGSARALAAPLPRADPGLIDDGETPIEDVVIAELAQEGAYRSFLLIGSDEAAGIADVVLLTVLPSDGSEPFIVSLPRDLYVHNRCINGYSRLNATLHGCDDMNGVTSLSLAVEDFTGIAVDHFALFDFAGFADIVDKVGGVEICVDHDQRDWRASLSIQAGCTIADGTLTLAWVRSRHPQEYVNGRWQSVEGASDLLRNQHQQEVVLALLDKLKTFDSPSDLARIVEDLAEAFTLDDRLGVGEAIALAWNLRNLEIANINRLEVPVVYATTKQGQSVLRAIRPFDEVLAELYPNLLEVAGGAASPQN